MFLRSSTCGYNFLSEPVNMSKINWYNCVSSDSKSMKVCSMDVYV